MFLYPVERLENRRQSAMMSENHLSKRLSKPPMDEHLSLLVPGGMTRKSCSPPNHRQEAGADATLVVTPFYNKPNQSGLRAHYEAVAAAADIPVVLYNVPGRTGCDMSPATINQLATIPGVIGVKEATADLDRIVPIMRGTPEGFILLSGDDFTALPFVLLGGDGVI